MGEFARASELAHAVECGWWWWWWVHTPHSHAGCPRSYTTTLPRPPLSEDLVRAVLSPLAPRAVAIAQQSVAVTFDAPPEAAEAGRAGQGREGGGQ